MARPTPTLDDDALWPMSGNFPIHLAQEKSGGRPALDFFRELAADHNRHRELAVVQARLATLAEEGRIPNREHFKHLDEHLWEVKATQVRVLLFRHVRIWFLTNGCIKKQDRLDPAVIDRANRIRSEQLDRLRIPPIRP